MAELNWGLFVVGIVIGFVLCYSICEMIFPVKDNENENDEV
jgi:hypothetical protein